ncbi:D-alanine--D-alanine ligase, partial [bacterium]|nr:D-alanine--D-alanine ligase [bacterium]
MKIAILHDAVTENSRPDEVDALHQAALVGDVLRELGHQVTTADVGLDLKELSTRLLQATPDVVFNLVESLAGHGRLIHVVPAMLEAWRIPFTGGGSIASLLTTNKPLTKAWLHPHGVPTPAWHYPQTPALLDVKPPCACIVKPVWEDASVGIEDSAVVQISRHEELDTALQAASLRCGEAFAEQFVEGREFNLSLLAKGDDVEVLPVAEIEFVDYPPDKPRIVGYAAKWS